MSNWSWLLSPAVDLMMLFEFFEESRRQERLKYGFQRNVELVLVIPTSQEPFVPFIDADEPSILISERWSRTRRLLTLSASSWSQIFTYRS
ncbi:hypothetical protein AArcCO_4035 (plasmid) [Halalkaliarchaeum sp. AArc-CO]|nr:hypothetical protein AArcCO_4035 [Halalkaliarchaeum sp. AArc-CO]